MQGGLYPYCKNPTVIHCPADRRAIIGGIYSAYDSYSAVNGLNGTTGGTYPTPVFNKESSVRHTSAMIVFVEENDPRTQSAGPYTVNENINSWCLPITGTTSTSDNWAGLTWWDGPAAYHTTSATFSFIDGHAENHKWLDPATIALGNDMNPTTKPSDGQAVSDATPAGGSHSPDDLRWVANGYSFGPFGINLGNY